MRDAVIFDMDGTLADVSGIRHLVVPAPGERHKDFNAFHEASVNVPAHDWVADAARAFEEAGTDVLVVTARKAKWRNHTAFWLALNGVPSTALFMRADNDHRPDREVKQDILNRIRNEGWDVLHAFDDNPKVIAVWEANGIDTTVVPGWETT